MNKNTYDKLTNTDSVIDRVLLLEGVINQLYSEKIKEIGMVDGKKKYQVSASFGDLSKLAALEKELFDLKNYLKSRLDEPTE